MPAVCGRLESCHAPGAAPRQQPNKNLKRLVLAKSALLTASIALILFAATAHAQQADITIGGSIALASKSRSASEAFLPPPEKGGTYASFTADVLLRHRYGLNVETAVRTHQGDYDGIEKYRPILTDVNAFYQPRIRKKIGGDFMAGIGVVNNVFYLPGGSSCASGATECFTSDNHFYEHLSGGVRYYVWHRLTNVFVRPEIHYYHIQNNREFHSDNFFRAGVSIGYTFGAH
jgi:hypothetical protein